MFLSSRHEIMVLFGTFLGGMVLGFVFDFFRIFRKNFKSADTLLWLQDVLMWAIMLAVVYITLFITNDGKIRWYVFVGFISGVAIYMVTLSAFIMKISTAVIGFLKKLFSVVITILLFPFKMVYKFLSKPLSKAYNTIRKLFKRILARQKDSFLRFCRIFKKI